MRKTKIVCTIGPASDQKETLQSMIKEGMNVARLNFSHGSHEEHLARIVLMRQLREEMGVPLAIMLDTRGPEIRIGRFEKEQIELKENANFTLTTKDIPGNQDRVSVNFSPLPSMLQPGHCILVNDGLIELEVKSCDESEIICRVVNGGPLSNNKSINLPGLNIPMPYLSEQDKSDILFAIENDLDFIALSFVRTAQDVLDIKRFLFQNGGSGIELIAKIENRSGIDHIDEIIAQTAGIMVARGDIGVEIPFEELPHIQKRLITKCYTAGKRVITATQMLESMIHNPRPTRAEITDVANAIYDGTSAIMLSGETASGKYPVAAIKTMAKIAEQTELFIDYKNEQNSAWPTLDTNVINAISHATCTTAHDLGAAAIVTVTRTGSTARMISRFRPATDIIAITPNVRTYRQLSLSWGVHPLMNKYKKTSYELFQDASSRLIEEKLARVGDIIVITGSSDLEGGITNTLQIHVLGNILLRGEGNSLSPVTGRLCIAEEDGSLHDFHENDIIVIRRTTTEILQLIRKSSGVITEESLSESGAAAACIALDIPIITSVKGAAHTLKKGCLATLDAVQGIIYNGTVCDTPPAH